MERVVCRSNSFIYSFADSDSTILTTGTIKYLDSDSSSASNSLFTGNNGWRLSVSRSENLANYSSFIMKPNSNKFVNIRPSGWTAKCAASQQRGPLQKRYKSKEES